MNTTVQPILSQRVAVRRACGHALIVMSCGHTYDAAPISYSIEKLIEILSRNIGKKYRCYKCEEGKKQDE